MSQLKVVGFKTGQPVNLGGSAGGLITLSGPGATDPGLQVTHSGSGSGFSYTDSGSGSGSGISLSCTYAAAGNAGIYVNYARAGFGIQVAQGDDSAAGIYVARGGSAADISVSHTGTGDGIYVSKNPGSSSAGYGISVAMSANTTAAGIYVAPASIGSSAHGLAVNMSPGSAGGGHGVWVSQGANHSGYGIKVVSASGGTGGGVFIDRNGSGGTNPALTINSVAGQHGIQVTQYGSASDFGMLVSMMAGGGVYIYDENSTQAGPSLKIYNNSENASVRGIDLQMDTSSTGQGIYVNSAATGLGSQGIYVNKTAGAAGIQVQMGASTTGIGLIVDTDGTGRAAQFTKNNATGMVVSVEQDHASNATAALYVAHAGTSASAVAIQASIASSKAGIGIAIIQAGSGDGLYIDATGGGSGNHGINVAKDGTGNSVNILKSGSSGYALSASSSVSGGDTAYLTNSNGGRCLYVNQTQANNAVYIACSTSGSALSIGASGTGYGIYVSSSATADAISVARGNSSNAGVYVSASGGGPAFYASVSGSGPCARLAHSGTGHGIIIPHSGTGYGILITQSNAGGPSALVVNDGSNDRLTLTRTGEIVMTTAPGVYVTVGPSSMRSSWTSTTGFQWEDANCSSVLTDAQTYWAGESLAAKTVPAFLWIPLEVPDQSVLTEVDFRIYQPVGTTMRFMLMRSDRTVNGGSKSLWKNTGGAGSWVTDGTHTKWQSGTYGAAALLTGSLPGTTLDRVNYDYWILCYISAGSSSPYGYVYNSYFYFNWSKVRPR